MTKYAVPPVAHGFLRLAAILALALGASACSTLASLDPTGLLSDDSSTSSGTTPDLSNVPNKPDDASTPDDQKQVAQSLSADGTQTQYSADALRAGTETAAAPPPPAGAVPPPPPEAAAPAPDASAPAPEAAPLPPADDTASSAPPPPAPAPMPVAAAPAPSGSEPAVPRNSGAHTRMAMASPSDAQLGFRPSAAPPLDSSITQWVQPSIVAHYRQTAENAGIAGSVPSGSGAVMPGKMDRTRAIALADGGVMPEAVVYFAGDGTTLNAAARAEIHAAVKTYNADGGQGTIRVVGHASSRTANMPVEKHLMLIFQKSQARADAVAKEIIRAGVPAASVLVDAVGDSQPVYYESMPKGEDGNRRAEIFFQK